MLIKFLYNEQYLTLFSIIYNYEKLIEFTGNWYLQFYKNKTNMFDFTLSQIDEYEKMASKKEIQWTE